MTLSEFTAATYKPKMYCMRPQIVCNDGFKMSVQGSEGHYCSPRVTTKEYYEMEIGFPSNTEDILIEYAEDKGAPTKTVYGYVPVEIIQQVIDKHGGINVNATFKNKSF